MSQKDSGVECGRDLSETCSSRTLSSYEQTHSSRFINLVRQKKELEEKLHLKQRECHIQQEKMKLLEKENHLLAAECAKLKASLFSTDREKFSLHQQVEIQSEKLLSESLQKHRSQLKSEAVASEVASLRGRNQIWKNYAETVEMRFQKMYQLMDSYIESMEMVILEDSVEAIARAIAMGNNKIRADVRSSKQQEESLKLEMRRQLDSLNFVRDQSVCVSRIQHSEKVAANMAHTQ